MKNHGFTTVASSVEKAVYQAIYSQAAAKAQTTALITKNAHFGGKIDGKVDEAGNIKQANVQPVEGIHYLDAKQAAEAWSMLQPTVGRPWQLWEREVNMSRLYVNEFRKAS